MTGGAASARRGSHYERQLVNHFHAAGWGVLRLPASGGATTRDLPDVLAGRPASPGGRTDYPTYTDAMAIEVKSGKATTLYVDEREVDDLCAFADRWGATPYLGARSTQQGTPTETFLVAPADARRTDGDAYGLPIDDIEERASAVVGSEGVEW